MRFQFKFSDYKVDIVAVEVGTAGIALELDVICCLCHNCDVDYAAKLPLYYMLAL